MAFDTDNLNAYDFIKSFRERLADRLEERLESGDFFPLLEGRETHSFDSCTQADEFYRNNTAKNASKPVQGAKSGKWNVAVDTKEHKPGSGSASNRVPNTFSSKNLKEEVEQLEERADTLDTDWTVMGDAEKDVVTKIRAMGRMLGSDDGAYASGVLMLTFKNKAAVVDFTTALEDEEDVDTYEIEVARDDFIEGFVDDKEYNIDDVFLDQGFDFNVYVYINADLVLQQPEELEVGDDFEWDDEEGNGFLTEVKRKIKVNFRGKKRIKMQCSPGFKWNGALKTCKKISGAQIAVMRKASRRATLTKKSMGQSFKARVRRKAKKANRFRKSFGLQS